ncbi:MAG: hypothetical protein ACYTGG_07755 [Planctomycetota bacterium]
MNNQRTGGMTAIGILNIIFGSLGTLGSLMLVLGGGLLAVGGAAMEAEMGAEAEGMGAAAAAGGGMIMIIGLVGAVVGGIGVLKCAPWGRTLSMLCCGVIGLMSVLTIVMGDFGIVTLGMIGYAGAQIGLFFKPEWKAAFGGETPMSGMSSVTSVSPIPGGSTAASATAAPHVTESSASGDDDSMQSAA